jgi:hypothetical protein
LEQLDIRDKYLSPMNNIILNINCTTKATTTCCHPQLLDLSRVVTSLHKNASKGEDSNTQKEYKKDHPGPPTTPTG